MNPVRRATPDSEAVGSSEDERPWPSSRSFGKFPMKENSVPGMPGGIWATPKRGSFKISDVAQRNAARDAALLGTASSQSAALRGASTPSPSAGEGASALPFAIPLQPTPKTGRSLSHSQGQREAPSGAGGLLSAAAGPASAAALPLGLLTEEDVDTDTESDVGSRLTHTTSHPPIGSLMRTATLPAGYDSMQGSNYSNNRDRPAAPHSPSHHNLLRAHTFEAAFANLSMAPDHPQRRASQWQSSLGWDNVPMVNESRRHSLAELPTRRGSLAAGEPSMLSRSYTHEDVFETESPESSQILNHPHAYGQDRKVDTADEHPYPSDPANTNNTEYDIPAMYRAPHVQLQEHERRELELRRDHQQQSTYYSGARPRKQLFVVSFKCSRVDVFYLLDNTGLRVREGDLVIVEADRGQDLGTVQHANVTQEAARMLKKRYSEEQYKWLMMYSRNQGGNNPNAQHNGESLFPDAPTTMQGTIPRDSASNLKPKAIKRLANEHEIKMLAEKEGNEAKAKRTCQQKVVHLRLQMEILDAEWQWDFQKLILYYYADHYINFKDLITDLYRIYKTRIWLSAINPASFSQHAVGQPPSGIGPGAVPPYNPSAFNESYSMTYGEDKDPYGAQMPYRIPYETYTPNFPQIPGVANSFAPSHFGGPGQYDYYGSALTQGGGSVADGGMSRGQATYNPDPFADRMLSNNDRGLYGAQYASRAPVPPASEYDGSPYAAPGPSAAPGSSRSMSKTWDQPLSTGGNTGGTRRQSAFQEPIGTRRASQADSFGPPSAMSQLHGLGQQVRYTPGQGLPNYTSGANGHSHGNGHGNGNSTASINRFLGEGSALNSGGQSGGFQQNGPRGFPFLPESELPRQK